MARYTMSAEEPYELAKKFHDVRADPRSYLHFVTPDVVEHILRPMATAITQIPRHMNPYPWFDIPHVNGMRHGVARWWWSNGKLRWEVSNVNGEQHGMEREFDEIGQLVCEKPHVNGKLHGILRRWHSNGQLRSETPYVNGDARGILREWYSDGQLKQEFSLEPTVFYDYDYD